MGGWSPSPNSLFTSSPATTFSNHVNECASPSPLHLSSISQVRACKQRWNDRKFNFTKSSNFFYHTRSYLRFQYHDWNVTAFACVKKVWLPFFFYYLWERTKRNFVTAVIYLLKCHIATPTSITFLLYEIA